MLKYNSAHKEPAPYKDALIKPISSELDEERNFEGCMHTSILLGANAYNDYFDMSL